jgi:predicted ATPase
LLFRRGQPPEARYIFKHALVQDAAYASLLRSHRQQLHTIIAEVLVTRFPETAASQPELLAHHYTQAGLSEQAVGYWQHAGQQASARSGYVEAIAHLWRGLEVLTTLPETTVRLQHELQLQRALGEACSAIQGYASREVAAAYTRARELCQQLGDTTQLAQVLFALWGYYLVQGDLRTACALGEDLLRLAQRLHAPALEVEAHWLWGSALSGLGDLVAARAHLDQDLPALAPQQDSLRSSRDVTGTRIAGLIFVCWALWCQGYPEQARKRMHATLDLAHDFNHPLVLTFTQGYTALLYLFRREVPAAQAHAEATVRLASEQGFAFWVAWGTTVRGWALVAQGQEAEGIAQIEQGLAAYRATGAGFHLPWLLPLLIEAYGKRGETAAALTVVAEALALVDNTGGHQWEAELYRLKGELLLHQRVPEPPQAEVCLHHALEVARQQGAKLLELRVAMSLGRMWQRQNKHEQARELLASVYEWFTEGFDTADLKDAKALLADLEA